MDQPIKYYVLKFILENEINVEKKSYGKSVWKINPPKLKKSSIFYTWTGGKEIKTTINHLYNVIIYEELKIWRMSLRKQVMDPTVNPTLLVLFMKHN